MTALPANPSATRPASLPARSTASPTASSRSAPVVPGRELAEVRRAPSPGERGRGSRDADFSTTLDRAMRRDRSDRRDAPNRLTERARTDRARTDRAGSARASEPSIDEPDDGATTDERDASLDAERSIRDTPQVLPEATQVLPEAPQVLPEALPEAMQVPEPSVVHDGGAGAPTDAPTDAATDAPADASAVAPAGSADAAGATPATATADLPIDPPAASPSTPNAGAPNPGAPAVGARTVGSSGDAAASTTPAPVPDVATAATASGSDDSTPTVVSTTAGPAGGPTAGPAGGPDAAAPVLTAPTGVAVSAVPAPAPAPTPAATTAAPLDAAPVPRGVGLDELGAQLGATLRRNERTQTLTIHLHPAELGAITIEARLVDGVTHLQLDPDSSTTADRLAATMSELRHQLSRAGVDVGDLDLGERRDRSAGDASTASGAPRALAGSARQDAEPTTRPSTHHRGGTVAIDL